MLARLPRRSRGGRLGGRGELLRVLDTPPGPPEDGGTSSMRSSSAWPPSSVPSRPPIGPGPGLAASRTANLPRPRPRRTGCRVAGTGRALDRVNAWIRHRDRLMSGSSGATRAEFVLKREAAECIVRDLRSVVFTPDSEFSDKGDVSRKTPNQVESGHWPSSRRKRAVRPRSSSRSALGREPAGALPVVAAWRTLSANCSNMWRLMSPASARPNCASRPDR